MVEFLLGDNFEATPADICLHNKKKKKLGFSEKVLGLILCINTFSVKKKVLGVKAYTHHPSFKSV